ncbi:hypothetical protein ACQ4PT_047925 [Festuca glaucescens]
MTRHRSLRLRPQIQASQDGAGMAINRSPRLRPQIHAGEQGAGVTHRRSPRLHPQIHANGDGAGVTRRIRRRRGTSPASPASLPDDDDMLREILIRLPPLPSSLMRASAVCRRWRLLITDPKFLRSFRAHHRKPPLLGVFEISDPGIVFNPILDTPDRITPQRFSLGRYTGTCELLDCHHGRVLVKDWAREELLVFDPITRQPHSVAVPPDLGFPFLHGAVLCADGDQGHVHGGCYLSPFKVVMVSVHSQGTRACVYSSETGICGNLISTQAPYEVIGKSAVLVGNCLYWLSIGEVIVKFDLDEHSLTVIRGPSVTNYIPYDNRQIIQAEDSTVGFAICDCSCFQMWQMNVNGHGATWVPWRTVEFHTILGFPPRIEGQVDMKGYDEDTGAFFIYVNSDVYIVQLKSRQSKRLPWTHHFSSYHPFRSFYTPGTAIVGGSNGAEFLHNSYDDWQV